ncbi:MAG TPA: hypothetical protein DDY70_00265, partial [Clostridiales bacterium]|nr:hypothetical protein [Clostridiales bacterium]
MKKILSLILALTLFSLSCVLLVSCGGNTPKKEPSVMTLSLNPEVEFVLDENGVVVSANALNEEGNLVLNAGVFVGKTNEEAVKLFIDITKDTGFLVSGSVEAGENNIKVAFSGEDAEKRYDAIKKNVTDYLDTKGITAGFENVAALTDAYFDEQLAKCLPYLDEAKITAMSYEEKLEALKASREETAKLTSEELKNAYYEAKELAYEKAKLEYVKEKANIITAAMIDSASVTYFNLCDSLEKLRYDSLIKEDSLYQVALAEFRRAKVEFLNYRAYVAGLPEGETTEAMTAHLDALEEVLNGAEQSLANAYAMANAAIDEGKKQLDSAYATLISTIKSIDSSVAASLDEASDHITTGLDTVT